MIAGAGAPATSFYAGHIEICGGIASGKTALAQLIARLEYGPTLEDFQSNPFWRAFYANPAAHSFETEISFLLQHYHHIKTTLKTGRPFACDFSPYLDLAYAHVTLSESKRCAFLAVYEEVKRELPPPTLLIHLQCGSETELERIRRRGRKVEDPITVDYLRQINTQLEHIVTGDASVRRLVLDSELLDFANNEETKRSVLNTISETLASTVLNT